MHPILRIVLLVNAGIFFLIGILLMRRYLAFARRGQRGDATVVHQTSGLSSEQRTTILEMQMPDGSTQRCSAQRLGLGKHHPQPGENVRVVYTGKKVFGRTVLNVFMVKDDKAAPYRVYAVIGGLLLAVALGLIIPVIR